MTQTEKIKAEIERLIALKESRVTNKRLHDLLSFIVTLEQEPSPKIKGWVARDVTTGHLVVYNNSDCWGQGLDVINIPSDWWKVCTINGPIEVELTIRKV